MMSFSWSQSPNRSSSRAYLSLCRAHPSPRCSFSFPFLSPRDDENKLSTGSGWKARGFAVHVPVHAPPGRKHTRSKGWVQGCVCLHQSDRIPEMERLFFLVLKGPKGFWQMAQLHLYIYIYLVKLRISRLFSNPEILILNGIWDKESWWIRHQGSDKGGTAGWEGWGWWWWWWVNPGVSVCRLPSRVFAVAAVWRGGWGVSPEAV